MSLSDSRLWGLKEFVRFSRLPDVRWVDHCPTDELIKMVVLTNALGLSGVDAHRVFPSLSHIPVGPTCFAARHKHPRGLCEPCSSGASGNQFPHRATLRFLNAPKKVKSTRSIEKELLCGLPKRTFHPVEAQSPATTPIPSQPRIVSAASSSRGHMRRPLSRRT